MVNHRTEWRSIESGQSLAVDTPRLRKKTINHWIGLRENLNRKPMGFYHHPYRVFHGFPVKIFPSSNSMN